MGNITTLDHKPRDDLGREKGGKKKVGDEIDRSTRSMYDMISKYKCGL
jgi:hypothetical protein